MARRKRQSGQALVETALVLSSLILMIVGIMDFGQFLFFHEALTDRARVGARYAAVNPYDVTAIKNMVVYNSDTAPDGATSGLFGLTTSYVTVTPTPSIGAPTYVQVRISGFPIQLLSPFLAKTYTHHPIIATRKTENIASAGTKN